MLKALFPLLLLCSCSDKPKTALFIAPAPSDIQTNQEPSPKSVLKELDSVIETALDVVSNSGSEDLRAALKVLDVIDSARHELVGISSPVSKISGVSLQFPYIAEIVTVFIEGQKMPKGRVASKNGFTVKIAINNDTNLILDWRKVSAYVIHGKG